MAPCMTSSDLVNRSAASGGFCSLLPAGSSESRKLLIAVAYFDSSSRGSSGASCCADSHLSEIAFRLTAIVMSVRSLSVGAIGMGLMRPPSTSVRPSTSTGAKTPGTAVDARIAVNSEPLFIQTSRCSSIAVATAVKPRSRSSIWRSPIRSLSTSKMRSPLKIEVQVNEKSRSRSTSRCDRFSAHSQ